MPEDRRKRKPIPVGEGDPRDTNKDQMLSPAEQRDWDSRTVEDQATEWDYDLQVIRELGLADYFSKQFEEYKKNPVGWSEAAFIRGLKQQPGFRQHSAAYQKDLEFELTLPEQYQAAVAADVEALRDQATKMGARVDDATLRDLAVKQRRGGLNTAQLQNALAGYLTVTKNRFEGVAGAAQDQLEQWADRNGLRISKDSIRQYVQRIAGGDATEDDVKAELRRTYLAGAYPAWADKINAGYDPSDLFSPYLESAKQLLEDGSLSLQDPIMQKITQAVTPDGKPTVMPLYEAQKVIRQDPRWQKTDNAYATYSSVADDVLRMFGFR